MPWARSVCLKGRDAALHLGARHGHRARLNEGRLREGRPPRRRFDVRRLDGGYNQGMRVASGKVCTRQKVSATSTAITATVTAMSLPVKRPPRVLAAEHVV